MTVAEAMSDRPPGTGAPMVRALEAADSDAIAALLVRLAEADQSFYEAFPARAPE